MGQLARWAPAYSPPPLSRPDIDEPFMREVIGASYVKRSKLSSAPSSGASIAFCSALRFEVELGPAQAARCLHHARFVDDAVPLAPTVELRLIADAERVVALVQPCRCPAS